MNFASDNAAGIAPEILTAISGANQGKVLSYGRDPWTKELDTRLAETFEREVAIFLVSTGTAANALAIAHLTPPWGALLCHERSHIATDECGAPEFFGGGIKLVTMPGQAGKIRLAGSAQSIVGWPASRHPGGALALASDGGGDHLPPAR